MTRMFHRLIGTVIRLDPWLLGAVLLLSIAGLLNLAGTATALLFQKQIIFVLLGFLLLGLFAALDYRWFRTLPLLGWFLWLVGLILLIAAAVWGTEVRGAQNWFFLGPLSIGPIEIVKLGVLIVLARYLAYEHQELVFPSRVILSAVVVLIPMAVTFLQPDFGSAMLLGIVWFGMVVVLRMPLRIVGIVLLVSLLSSFLVWTTVFHDYQRERILSFFSPEADPFGAAYQSRQAMVAIGAGGLFGRGFFEETLASNLAFLPESATDFAFAAFVERAGLFGALMLFAAFVFVLLRILRVGSQATNNFSRVYALGLFLLLSAEAGLNIAMNAGFLPVSGTPLPFLSYGGSHTLLTFASLGLLESIRLHQPGGFAYDRDIVSVV